MREDATKYQFQYEANPTTRKLVKISLLGEYQGFSNRLEITVQEFKTSHKTGKTRTNFTYLVLNPEDIDALVKILETRNA